MRDAFEMVEEDNEDNVDLSKLVAVHCWIRYDTRELQRQFRTREYQPSDQGQLLYFPGNYYERQGGRATLTKRRWNFWKDRFEYLTSGLDPGDEIRVYALLMRRF